MASDLPVHISQHEVVCESVESLRVQIKEIEDKWNDELKRLETALKDKEELERILQVLQTFLEYERAATLKMEAMVKQTRDTLGIGPEEASRPAAGMVYDPSKSTGSSSSGESSALEFALVYNPYAAPKASPEMLSVSSPPSLSDANDQVTTPLLPVPATPASKPKRSPNWKSKITSILISTNNHNRTNPPSPPAGSLNSTTPFFDVDADSSDAKPKRAAKSPKRPFRDSENHGTARWRRTVGPAGNKFANRANRDINRKKLRDLTSIAQG